jgi:hypothetical protein
MSSRRVGGGWPGAASIALATTLVAAPGVTADRGVGAAPEVAVKAGFINNFAKFADWPAMPSGAPIAACIVGDDAVADALANTALGQNIGGRTLEVRRVQDSAVWRFCQLLFVADAETRRSAAGLAGIKTLPILTVSDSKGFSEASGIIELFREAGKMRFAINVDAAELAGLHLSSRLLGLAKVVRNSHVQ